MDASLRELGGAQARRLHGQGHRRSRHAGPPPLPSNLGKLVLGQSAGDRGPGVDDFGPGRHHRQYVGDVFVVDETEDHHQRATVGLELARYIPPPPFVMAGVADHRGVLPHFHPTA